MPLWAIITLVALIMVVALAIYTTPLFWWAKTESFLVHRAGASYFKSSRGDLEYAVQGEGVPLLVMHGAGGSYRQGLLITRLVDPSRVRVVSISRPGYRFTPLDTGRSFEAQADAALELLDFLKIDRAAVLGISAGGTPAVQFALRHADRCAGLILFSAAIPSPYVHNVSWMPALFRVMLASDFLIWLALNLPLPVIIAPHGWVDPARLRDPRTHAMLLDLLAEMNPASAWSAGVINDLIQYANYEAQLPLEALRVPALVIHGTHDSAVPYRSAQDAADRIPGAKLFTIERGTHFSVATHYAEIGPEIERFLGLALT